VCASLPVSQSDFGGESASNVCGRLKPEDVRRLVVSPSLLKPPCFIRSSIFFVGALQSKRIRLRTLWQTFHCQWWPDQNGASTSQTRRGSPKLCSRTRHHHTHTITTTNNNRSHSQVSSNKKIKKVFVFKNIVFTHRKTLMTITTCRHPSRRPRQR